MTTLSSVFQMVHSLIGELRLILMVPFGACHVTMPAVLTSAFLLCTVSQGNSHAVTSSIDLSRQVAFP